MKDNAPYFDMSQGLHGIDYKQKFVRAPHSSYPQKEMYVHENVEGNQAMKITMGKK